MVAHSMKAGSGCSSIAVFIDSKGYASISIATDVHRCPAYIPSVVFRTSTRVNDGTVWLGYAAAAMVDERRRQREEQHEIERMALTQAPWAVGVVCEGTQPGPRRFAGRSTTNFLLPIASWAERTVKSQPATTQRQIRPVNPRGHRMPATLSTSEYVAATADRIRSQVSRLGVLGPSPVSACGRFSDSGLGGRTYAVSRPASRPLEKTGPISSRPSPCTRTASHEICEANPPFTA
jgi:hypothetical protein